MLIAEIIWIVLVIVCLVGLGICLRGLYESGKLLNRKQKVHRFRLNILDLAAAYNERRFCEGTFTFKDDAGSWFFNKYTYEEMLYSDKPLTLEAWYNKEEITKINS